MSERPAATSSNLPDPVRPGEELPADRLSGFLEPRIDGLGRVVDIRQFTKGYSNLTYLVRGERGEVVLRRGPRGSTVKSAHDMGREFRILSGLARQTRGPAPADLSPPCPTVPRALLYSEDPSVIGAPFYVMTRVDGLILRGPDSGLAPEIMRGVSETLVDTLAGIHRVDVHARGLADLGRPEGYVARQVDGWTRRYRDAATDAVPALERAIAWIASHQPPRSDATLVHNDFKHDNLVLDPADPTRVTAVLDWEMATIGDPLMDLGTTLGYWVDPDDPPEWKQLGFGPTTMPGNLSRPAILDRYGREASRDVSNAVFYYVFGLVKIATIVQQIYKRFRLGQTSDPRFAGLGAVVGACGTMATRAIDRDRIDRLG
jgi:aminoglycoside phosphotransferase (APT) family kinase protein